MRHSLSAAAIILCAAQAFAQQPTTLLIDDFETESTWDGITIDGADARSGGHSGLWIPREAPRVSKDDVPADWSDYDRLVFWLHSEVANGQSLTVLADSLNEASDGWDYFYHHFTVDWEGWRLMSFRLGDDIRPTRQPVGWHSINYVALSASGWSNTVLDDTILRVDGMRLVRDPASLEHIGHETHREDGAHVVTHRYALTNRTEAAASFPLAIEGDFALFSLAPGQDRTPEIAAGEEAEITVTLIAPLSEIEAARPLMREEGRLLVGAMEDGLPAVMAPIAAAVPLPELERPLLFASREEIDCAKDRADRYDWARTRLDSILASGDAALELVVEVPDEGGQWSHHYVCENCGVRLRTASPTEHVCTRCEKVHTGWPYDQVVIAREHSRLTGAVEELGLAYAFTDDVRYAEKAREILLAYGQRYRDFPYHDKNDGDGPSGGRLFAQTLDEAVRIIGVAWGYDLIWDSGVFSDEDRRIVEDGYLRPVAETIRRNARGISNWQSWHNAGIAAIGFCLRDAELASLAIEGQHGLRFQLANSVLSDGFWYEGAVAYHFYALNALRWTVEAAWRSGLDFHDNAVYRSLYEAPLHYVFPDLTFPAVNDSDRSSITGRHALYEIAYARFGDPLYVTVATHGNRTSLEALLWGVDELPPAPSLDLASRTFDGLGVSVLRAGQGEQQTYAHLVWGPHGGGHGHPDKLSLILYALGHELAPDPGRLAYGASLQGSWYKQTVSHSTVLRDERSQRAAEGRRTLFHDGEIARIVQAECDTAYPGVLMRRTLLLADDYLIDLFDVESEERHTFDWVYHNIGSHVPSFAADSLEGPLGDSGGYQHITDVSTAAIDGTWQHGFVVPDAARVQLTMLGEPGTRVYLGTGLTGRGIEPRPAVVVRRDAQDASWISAIEWRDPESDFAITGIERLPVEAAGDAVAIRIDRTDGYDVLILAPGVEGEKRAGGVTTEGQLAFFNVRDGEVTGMERVDVLQ